MIAALWGKICVIWAQLLKISGIFSYSIIMPNQISNRTEGLTGQEILRILYTCDKEKLEAAGSSLSAADFLLINSGFGGQLDSYLKKWEYYWPLKRDKKNKEGTI